MYNFVVIHGIVVFAGILYFIYRRMQTFYGRMSYCGNKAAGDEAGSGNRVALSAMCALMAVFFESYFDVDLIWADYALNLMFLLCVINSAFLQRGEEEPEKTVDEVSVG
jgi:hypothetical protein